MSALSYADRVGVVTAAAPVTSTTRRGGDPVALLAIRILAAGALAVSAYLHAKLALQHGLSAPLISLGQLFAVQAVVTALAAVLVVLWDRKLPWLAVSAVAVGSLVPLLASVYFPLPAVGPLPAINEPVWYWDKVLSAAVEAAVPALWLVRRIAPPAA